MEISDTPLSKLSTHPANVRQGDVGAIVQSLKAHGQYRPIVAQRSTGYILAGNHTYQACKALKYKTISVTWVDCDDDQALRILLVDNRSNDLATYDDSALVQMLTDLMETEKQLEGTGFDPDDLDQLLRDLDMDDDSNEPEDRNPTLMDRFILPPFSVLDQRSGDWQERKRRWLTLGIKSEEGRSAGDDRTGLTITTLDAIVPDYYSQKKKIEKKLGRELSKKEFETEHLRVSKNATLSSTGTSIFDPVICELAYRWFCPTGGTVLDPFAGGSVRGIVASMLGLPYIGVDLRREQTSANELQWAEIRSRHPDIQHDPQWIAGDSRYLSRLTQEPADLVFSCPPYADLETYSDDPADISNMDYLEFLAIYTEIIKQAVDALRPNSFAVWVVGDVREKKGGGAYRGFVPDTIRAFEQAGARYYNEGIIVSPIGSLAVRVGRQFSAGRKLGKCHQNLLVFVKGDPKKASERCGIVEVEIPEDVRGEGDDLME